MPAVQTQQLAQISDLTLHGPLPAALGSLTSDQHNAGLRRASGEVLSAYGKRYPRTPGASFTLAKWGDFTIGMVVSIYIYRALTTGPRGLNPSDADVANFKGAYDETVTLLNEIADLDNPNPRMDPDAVGSPDADDAGPLFVSEGGPFDDSTDWVRAKWPQGVHGSEMYR